MSQTNFKTLSANRIVGVDKLAAKNETAIDELYIRVAGVTERHPNAVT